MASFRSHLQALKQTLAPMSWKARLDHLWTYYKWVPITLLAVILSASSIIPSVLESKKQVLFGGLCVNFTLPESTEDRLNEELFTYFGGTDHSRQKIVINYGNVSPNNADVYAAYAESSVIAAQIAGRELDFLLIDTAAKDYFGGANITTSLESLLTAQQLEQLQERLLYRETAEGITIPFAIDLSNTAFAAACGLEEDGLFVVFPGNTARTQYIDEFVDYLMNWE